ncbi:TIGR03087 family PEP-CTERM/XrtA system glycosyltransferase [uncultured Sphingomonas sp.]|uniref:TIGR03087 family PEP-CTERM/XrtA system glycosyltransferase n=1 Tax=uncultured Sphingomonas sp. TaxID=158754 RepID=UPI0026081B6C|nr:TIGR03087 family PEP-CTERM/XrtA system glycosyltransferase [uncultured Sphingomonas sp.]
MKDLLFLAHRAPFPPDRGDKIRSFHILSHLATRARVHLCAFADDPADRVVLPDLAKRLASCRIVPRTKSTPRAGLEALASGRPLSLTAFADRRMTEVVADVMHAHPIAATYVFSGQMAPYAPQGVPVTMDMVDVDSAKFAQLAEDVRGPMAWVYAREARLLGAFERSVAAHASATLFVSEAEAALFRAGGGDGRIVAVENGIDAAAYDPALCRPVATAAETILFTGQMDYRPNVEAVTWFADHVLPIVRRSRPAAQFVIVGRAPVAAVTRLGARDGVVVTGTVPDVRGWLAAARVCVAPLRLARGIQNKVLEAMAMARPVVATPAAAEGIDHGGTIAVADAPEAFAAAVIAALDGPTDRPEARAQVLARYDWDARLAPLGALLGLNE